MAKRSPEEIWQRLVDEAGEDEVERAASVSVAQAEKELAEAGFDVAAERAKATAFLVELESEPPVSGPIAIAGREKEQRPRVRARWAVSLAAAMAAVLAGIAIPTISVVSQSPKKHAAELRRDAFTACDAKRYKECQERLDQALVLDPEGEQTSEVRARRRTLQDAPRAP